jgi:hypothetical protein
MFSDLVGSTSLAATLDTEDWRDLVGAYLDDAGKAIGQYGGHVAKKLGDRLMALFGYPRAQENYAERSVKERGTTLPKPCCTQPDARVLPAAGFFSCFRCNQLKKSPESAKGIPGNPSLFPWIDLQSTRARVALSVRKRQFQ